MDQNNSNRKHTNSRFFVINPISSDDFSRLKNQKEKIDIKAESQ